MSNGMIQYQRLRNSSVPTWVGLVLGSWVGLACGSLLSLPVGVGFGIAAGSALGGFLVVPLWGTVWGLVGLGKQREAALREHKIKLLKEDDPLAKRVHAMAGNLGLPRKPWVAVMQHNNAYAIGGDVKSAMVVVGRPLLSTLSDDEIDAIIGHELGHIANNDMRRMGLAHSFQNSLVWYLGFSRRFQLWARWLLTWLSELLVLGLSRKREYWADAIGATLTSKEAMISALEKLHEKRGLSGFEREHARLMFHGFDGGSLFSTHPTLLARVTALEAEIYMRHIPVLLPDNSQVLPPAVVLPRAEDIAYAKGGGSV